MLRLLPNSAILLTASINTRNCMFVKRSNPILRENDYCEAIVKWSELNYPVIFCENSGYNLSKIKKIGHRVNFLQFDGQDYDRKLGKGFGELKINEVYIFCAE